MHPPPGPRSKGGATTPPSLAPIDAAAAETLLRSLACALLLEGARGRPPLDLAATAEAVAALSRFAAAARIVLNPHLHDG